MIDLQVETHPLSERRWISALTEKGRKEMRAASMSLYGDQSHDRILLVGEAMEGTFVILRMAANGCVIRDGDKIITPAEAAVELEEIG
jgi:hypothetical protein